MTVIPKSTFEEITTAHFVVNGPEQILFGSDSIVVGYGAGWGCAQFLGRNVGYDIIFY